MIVVKDVCQEAQARAMIRDFKQEEALSYTDSFQSKAWIYRLPRPGALVHVMWEICYSQWFLQADCHRQWAKDHWKYWTDLLKRLGMDANHLQRSASGYDAHQRTSKPPQPVDEHYKSQLVGESCASTAGLCVILCMAMACHHKKIAQERKQAKFHLASLINTFFSNSTARLRIGFHIITVQDCYVSAAEAEMLFFSSELTSLCGHADHAPMAEIRLPCLKKTLLEKARHVLLPTGIAFAGLSLCWAPTFGYLLNVSN